jgi:hypothetical protein
MAAITAKLVGDGGALLERTRRVAKRPLLKIGPRVANILKDGVLAELDAEETRSASGTVTKFRPAIDFERRPPGKTLGGSTGGVGRAWASARVTTSGRAVALLADLGPRGGVFLGGGGTSRSARVTVIKAKQNPSKMRGAIFHRTGAHFSRKKLEEGVKVYSRSHGAVYPAIMRKIEAVMVEELTNA